VVRGECGTVGRLASIYRGRLCNLHQTRQWSVARFGQGSVKALGPIGVVVGPMIVAFLQALLKMVQIELEHLGD